MNDRLARLNTFTLAVMHVLPLTALGVEARPADWGVCLALYWLRMFGVTAGYHRYFSHRTFRLNRSLQFALALLAQTSGQKGVLWWAAHHRAHHKHSDTARDIHSPVHYGFWRAHLGWFLDPRCNQPDYRRVRDLARFPELVWLDRYFPLPAWGLGALCFLVGGYSMLVIGFVLSTLLVLHATYAINSVCHGCGTRRFETRDTSRNNPWLAILTMGEGWHNNHHYYPSVARQGFRWWEIDLTYYLLKGLSLLGLVRNLRELPARVRQAISPAGGRHGSTPAAATSPTRR